MLGILDFAFREFQILLLEILVLLLRIPNFAFTEFQIPFWEF